MPMRFFICIILLGCGQGNTGSGCPDGLVSLEDRCVVPDAGLGDACRVAEETCNGVDDDCDGDIDEDLMTSTFYADADGDMTGDRTVRCEACAIEYCDASMAWVADSTDCDDSCDTCFVGADEVCDDRDNDCDNLIDEGATRAYFVDLDGDGFATTTSAACAACDPASCDVLTEGTWVLEVGDCDDTCAACYPDNAETCDDEDNDCDGRVDEGTSSMFYRDADGDGHGDVLSPCNACDAATCGDGDWVPLSDDCDDSCASCFPGGVEVCDDKDNDCDGAPDDGLRNTFYQDVDGDSYGSLAATMVFCGTVAPIGWAARSGDCADGDARAHPGAGAQGTPIMGVHTGGPYDFDCDGSESNALPLCSDSGTACSPTDLGLPGGDPDCRQVDGACGAPTMVWRCSCAFPVPVTCSSMTGMGEPAACH